MSTHSKKKKTSVEGGMKTTTYKNQGGATGRFGGVDSPAINPSKNTPAAKKEKKPHFTNIRGGVNAQLDKKFGKKIKGPSR